MSDITLDDLPIHRMAEATFAALVDVGQNRHNGSAHSHLEEAAYRTAYAVVGILQTANLLRLPLTSRKEWVHGTTVGSEHCSCEYCREARNVYDRARRHYQKQNV